MRKIVLAVIFSCFAFSLHAGTAFSEPYKGTSFPEESMIKGLLNRTLCLKDHPVSSIVGKRKIDKTSYEVFFSRRGYNEIYTLTVYHLDNNFWLMHHREGCQSGYVLRYI